MKTVFQLGCAAFLLAFASCATGVGEWDGGIKDGNAATLRQEVRDSLIAQNWSIVGDTATLTAVHANPGGHRTIATFTFADTPPGSTFNLRGGSHHRVNWLTFGILGLSMRSRAAIDLTNWYEAWAAKHPRN